MLKPKALRPGGRVAVIAPASPFTRQEFDEGIAELERLGFEPVFDPSVFAREGGYLSGDGRLRARAFLDAWRDPTVDAIIAARGGYGSVHMLPYLDREVLRLTPKPFVGYSDVTSLLTYLTVGCEIVSFHGPMLAGKLGKGTSAYDPDSFLRALGSTDPLGELAPASLEVLRPGEAVGALYGGTLVQLVATLGTPFAFAHREASAVSGGCRERPYRLDRMPTQLRLAGVLDRAAARPRRVHRCDEPTRVTARGVFADLLKAFNGPVVFDFLGAHDRAGGDPPVWRERTARGDGEAALVIERLASVRFTVGVCGTAMATRRAAEAQRLRVQGPTRTCIPMSAFLESGTSACSGQRRPSPARSPGRGRQRDFSRQRRGRRGPGSQDALLLVA